MMENPASYDSYIETVEIHELKKQLADRDRRLKEIADACMDSEFASSLTEYRLLFRIHKLATGEGE